MKQLNKTLNMEKKNDYRTISIIGTAILILQLVFHLTVGAKQPIYQVLADSDSIKHTLISMLEDPQQLKNYNYPNTVKRFYTLNNLETNWLRPEPQAGHTMLAMLLLDCVKQYGLQPQNYHPKILTYERLRNILAADTKEPIVKKVEFELMLTDAMISVINNLHYGSFNPALNRYRIDDGIPNGLQAEVVLGNAIKSADLKEAILDVQPKTTQYVDLQQYMKLIVGQYICDSYETPKEEIRTIAINMERLRWLGSVKDSYILVNIPSFQLFYHTPKLEKVFKVVVGTTSTPTPSLASEINSIETAPDWKIPHKIFIRELLPKAAKDTSFFNRNHIAVYDEKDNIISIDRKTLAKIKQKPSAYHAKQTAGCDNALGRVVFRFSNTYDIYLHDTPEQQYFARSRRAFSHGCIRVENADKLAALLLQQDCQQSSLSLLNKSMSSYSKQIFKLQDPVPIKIGYFTISVVDGLLVRHQDLYQLDQLLMDQMFTPQQQITSTNH